MNELDLNERLTELDIFEASHDGGVYALEVAAPSIEAEAKERWDRHHDARPDDDTLERIAAAETVLYVGASHNVYHRLTEHVAGEVYQAAFLEAFPPVDVYRVWPTESYHTEEYNRAAKLGRQDGIVAWRDGVLHG